MASDVDVVRPSVHNCRVPDIDQFVPALLAAVLTPLAFWAISSLARSRGEVAAHGMTLRYPLRLRLISALPALVFLGAGLIETFQHTSDVWLAGGLLALGAMGAFLPIEFLIARVQIDETGFAYRSMLKRRSNTPWADITKVAYWERSKAFMVELDDRTQLTLSVLLSGLPSFALMALAHAKQAEIDFVTRRLLENTAQGAPPRFFELG